MASSASAAPVIIDEFIFPTGNGFLLDVNPSATSDSQTDTDSSIIGGERETDLTLVAPAPDVNEIEPVAKARLTPGGSPNKVVWSNDAGVQSLLEFLYDGVGSAGLGGLNLVDGSNDALLVDVIAVDQNIRFEWYVEDTDGNFATSMLTTTDNLEANDPDSPQTLEFKFVTFAGVDFTKVKSLKLSVWNESGSGDATFTFLRAGVVPEPASLCLLGMAGLSFGFGAWRRNRRSSPVAA